MNILMCLFHRRKGRFLISFDGIIDLLTILPFFFLSGMVIFRMLRVARIFHLFRLNARYDSQPEVFRNAFSGIWWSMSTLLTVGYGDIYPITTLGRIMAICIAYLGVGAVARSSWTSIMPENPWKKDCLFSKGSLL